MLTQSLDPKTKTGLIGDLAALVQEKKIGVFAREKDVPRALASLLISAALDQVKSPLYDITHEDGLHLLRDGRLQYDTRHQKWTARRTLAAIIRKEIADGRLVIVFSGASRLLGGGVEVPEHYIYTQAQWSKAR